MAKNYDYGDRLAFQVEWYDHEASHLKKFILSFYLADETLELFDRDINRVYLKRSKTESLTKADLFVGNTIRVYGRQIKILDYADDRTKNCIGVLKECTFTMIKAAAIDRIGLILSEIYKRNYQIAKLRMCTLTRKDVLEFYAARKGDPFLPFILEQVISGPAIALVVVGENAVQRFQDDLGPVDPIEARRTSPNSLRAIIGRERSTNGFHGCLYKERVERESNFFFVETPTFKPPVTTFSSGFENSTCCVIKPHVILDGKLGHIIKYIRDNHFELAAMQMFYLSDANADEFLEVYKGVVSDYHAMLMSYLDGPCVVLQVTSDQYEDVHQEFRKFAGPVDPSIARQIRPSTLRAQFGCDRYKNGVHCTDLPEDVVLELEYFFKVLKW